MGGRLIVRRLVGVPDEQWALASLRRRKHEEADKCGGTHVSNWDLGEHISMLLHPSAVCR